MARGLTDDTNYQAIANAIRQKNGSVTTYLPEEMAEAVLAINGSSEPSEPSAPSGLGVLEVQRISFTLKKNLPYCSIILDNGFEEELTFGVDEQGNVISVSNARGHFATVEGVVK